VSTRTGYGYSEEEAPPAWHDSREPEPEPEEYHLVLHLCGHYRDSLLGREPDPEDVRFRMNRPCWECEEGNEEFNDPFADYSESTTSKGPITEQS
jgi:hypothetical protein